MPVETRNYKSIQEDSVLLVFFGTGSSFTSLSSMTQIAVWTP
jgi:hypothetical protein